MATTSVLNSDWSTKFTLPPQPTGKPEEDVAALSETLKSHILMIREMARELNTGAIIQLGDAATSVGATAGALRYVTRPQWHDGTVWRDFGGTGGGSHRTLVTKTADYTATATDAVIICNSTSAITITLPDPVRAGTAYSVQNSSTGAVTVVSASGALINDESSQVLMQYECIVTDWDGSAWWVTS